MTRIGAIIGRRYGYAIIMVSEAIGVANSCSEPVDGILLLATPVAHAQCIPWMGIWSPHNVAFIARPGKSRLAAMFVQLATLCYQTKMAMRITHDLIFLGLSQHPLRNSSDVLLICPTAPSNYHHIW